MLLSHRVILPLFFVSATLLLFLAGCSDDRLPSSTVGRVPPEYTIRVLLKSDVNSACFEVFSGYDLSCDSNYIGRFARTARPFTVSIENSRLELADKVYPQANLIIVEPDADGAFKFAGKKYRGRLEFVISSDDANHFSVINSVSVEDYLKGVVAAEMPSYWPGEALKAQAVAARSYCLFIKDKFGRARDFDVRATQANQVYKGILAESLRTSRAVDQTFGMILQCPDADGNYMAFPAYYSSVCGGHTENSKNVFGDEYVSLTGVECPYCSCITNPRLFYWPMAEFKKQYVTERIFKRYPQLRYLGSVKRIEAFKEEQYGEFFSRLLSVKLLGRKDTQAILRAEDMRLAIDPTGMKIQSTSCSITNFRDDIIFVSGRGFGHGVGLCQYGSRQMAVEGKTAAEILKFYYPQSRIKVLY